MKPLEVIWFENISAFNEQVLALGPMRVSMKQLLYTLMALALAMSLLNFAKNLILAIAVPAFLLMLAFLRPYGQGLEVLLIDMIGFFGRKKSIGVGVEREEDKVKKEKEKEKIKDKDKRGKGKEEKEAEVAGTGSIATAAVTTQGSAMPLPDISMPIHIPAPEPAEPTAETTKETIVAATAKSNLLHYIVPSAKDLNLEIAEKEYVIATGDSTIHISSEGHDNAVVVIEVKDKAITRIVVNKQ